VSVHRFDGILLPGGYELKHRRDATLGGDKRCRVR
jgi:hypothetical protein